MRGRTPLVALAVLLLVVGLAAPAPATGQTPRAGRSITGRVVFQGGDPPYTYDVYVSRVSSLDDDDDRKLHADENGVFASPPLEPGLYYVFVLAVGYHGASGDDEKVHRPGDAVTVTMQKNPVVTGTVTDAAGEPMGGVRVQSIQVRDADGRALERPMLLGFNDAITDDRGVYRLYDIEAGSYLIMAGRPKNRDYSDNVRLPGGRRPAVYYPASGRRDAEEVAVAWGEERSGVDIRYVERKGYTISGSVTWAAPPADAGVRLAIYAPDGVEVDDSYADMTGRALSFEFTGEADGDYELVASGMRDFGDDLTSASRRIVVRGADVRDVRLVLAPLPPRIEVAGRVTLDPRDPKRAAERVPPGESIDEIGVLGAPRPEPSSGPRFGARPPWPWTAVPDASGAFQAHEVRKGAFRLSVDLPSDDWYVRGVSRGPKGDPAVRELALAEGQKVTDLVVMIGRSAAGVAGTIAPPSGAEKARPDLVVYFVPSDPALAANLWRYYEVLVRDGAFEARNLAPGAYWLLARPAPSADAESPLWDPATRATLRADAEAAKQVVELAPRERAKGAVVTLRYDPSQGREDDRRGRE